MKENREGRKSDRMGHPPCPTMTEKKEDKTSALRKVFQRGVKGFRKRKYLRKVPLKRCEFPAPDREVREG